jgi:hypothetical protein
MSTSFLRYTHREEVVRTPAGTRYRVRVGRTGITPWIPWNPNSQLMLPVTWLRYLLRKPKTWTVEVRIHRPRGSEPRVDEQYPTRTQAARRADHLADAIASGAPVGSTRERHTPQ